MKDDIKGAIAFFVMIAFAVLMLAGFVRLIAGYNPDSRTTDPCCVRETGRY